MTRVLAFLVHNWPLKIAALVLSTLLYGILIVSQGSRQENVRVPIEPRAPLAENVTLLTTLGDVTTVRYLAAPDVPVTSATFAATVDLSAPGIVGATQAVPVSLVSLDDRVSIVSFEPRRITVNVDEVIERELPITVNAGTPPTDLEVREPELSVETATVRGAASAVRRVQRLEAPVLIDPAGLSIDRDVEVVPLDAEGEEVREVDVDPATVRVRIDVLNDADTIQLPVAPNVIGQPPAGFRVAGVSVEPGVVTVQGNADAIASLSSATTEQIPVDGASSTFTRAFALALPPGVVPLDREQVTVTVTIEPHTDTRVLDAAVVLDGARADLAYDVAVREVLVTVFGAVTDLDRLEGRALEVMLPVGGLGPGTHEVTVEPDLPPEVEFIAAGPPRVRITITAPAAVATIAPGSPAP